MRLGFACPYLNFTGKVVLAQMAAQMHVAWQHPWVANIATIRTPHIPACDVILKRALANTKIDALFWTEDDCVLPIDAVTRLVRLLETHPEACAATGITFMRLPPHHPMVAEYAGILTEEVLARERPLMIVSQLDGEPVVGKEHYKFVTRIDTSAPPYLVDATSMNCLLLPRRTLEVMAEIPDRFATGHFTTPDFALFARLRETGKLGRVVVDPALLTGHIGEPPVIGADDWIAEMEKAVAEGRAERRPDGETSGGGNGDSGRVGALSRG